MEFSIFNVRGQRWIMVILFKLELIIFSLGCFELYKVGYIINVWTIQSNVNKFDLLTKLKSEADRNS